MKYLKKFNEIAGGYRGLNIGRFWGSDTRLPSTKDIKDILKGLSLKKVLKWTPPKRKAFSSTEIDLRDKKREILKIGNCPENWMDIPVTWEDVSSWSKRDTKKKIAKERMLPWFNLKKQRER